MLIHRLQIFTAFIVIFYLYFYLQSEMMSLSLGSASQFNTWGRGVNHKGTDSKPDNRSIVANNMYGPLSKERDNDKKHNIVRYLFYKSVIFFYKLWFISPLKSYFNPLLMGSFQLHLTFF